MKRSCWLLLLLPLAACSAVQAKTPVERPNLEVPPPPPRVIEPMIQAEPTAPEPVGDLPASPPTPRPRPAPSREPAKPDPAKTEPPPVEPPPATPPATTPPVPTAPQLRTPNSPSPAEAERQVREAINRANTALSSTDYRALNRDQQAQYDNAKLMLKQAEDAIKAANFDFARNLAEKAEKIAKELQGR